MTSMSQVHSVLLGYEPHATQASLDSQDLFSGASFSSIAWRPPLPIACNASISLPLVSKRKDYSSFIDKCVGSPNYRLAVGEFMKSRFLFRSPERVGEIARWFQRL